MANKDMERPRYASPAAKSTVKQGRVSEKTISDIKKAGMTASLKKASTSDNPEFLKGVARMYGNERLANARNVNKTYAPIGLTPGFGNVYGSPKSNFSYNSGNTPDMKKPTSNPRGANLREDRVTKKPRTARGN